MTLLLIGFLIGSFLIFKHIDFRPVPEAMAQSDTSAEPSPASDAGEMDRRVQKAQEHIALSQWQPVIDLLRPYAEQLDSNGLRLLAKAYAGNKNYLQEIRILQFVITQNKNDYVSYERLARALLATDNGKDAIKNFQVAITINPRFRPAYDGLLVALDKAGRAYDQRETLLEMITRFGPQPEFHNELCRLYYEGSFLKEAREQCQSAIDRSPKHADNHVYLGLTFRSAKDLPRALQIVQKAAQQFPQSEVAQFYAGSMNEENKNVSSAYTFYKQGSVADKSSLRCWLGFARNAFELRKYAEALTAFDHACTLNGSGASQDFRNAATKLRLDENSEWVSKFDAQSLKCRVP